MDELEYGGFPIDPGFGLWKSDISNIRIGSQSILSDGNWIMEMDVRSDQRSVDNESNSQS